MAELPGIYMDVSKNRGKPPKWMVNIVENPMNKWMIWGETPIFLEGHPYPSKIEWDLIPTDCYWGDCYWVGGRPKVYIILHWIRPETSEHSSQ